MANHRRREHTSARVADRDERRTFAPATCAACGAAATGVLCEPHWYALPWGLRNDVGPLVPSRADVPAGWLSHALRVLGGRRRPLLARAPLTYEEQRMRPVALQVLAGEEPGCPPEGEKCPWARCRWNLLVTVTEAGTLQEDVDIDEVDETCAIRVAARGGMTAKEAGRYVGLSRARVQQMERKLQAVAEAAGLRHLLD